MKPSSKTALCGLMGALSLVCLALTFFPFATYALPALASIFLFPVVIECGRRHALLLYVATAVLALWLAPDPEAKILYVVFFGYYPVLKATAEPYGKVGEWALKLGTFNAAVLLAYFLLTKWGFSLSEFALGGLPLTAAVVVFWIIGNVVFVLYDVALTRALSLYFLRFQPLVRRLFR